MWIHRDLEEKVQKSASQRPAVLLTGSRQTGKTSLLRYMFPNHHFVSLDLPSEAEQADLDPAAFLRRHSAPLILDEVQYSPGVFRQIKIQIDKKRTAKGQYLLTGSQQFSLMKGVSESLAGRVGVLTLETLSIREIGRAYPKLDLEKGILRGGFPELYQDFELDAVSFYRSYVATYLERDLRSAMRVTSLRDFERFLRSCAIRSGQLLNKADLARDVGISAPTANEWLSVLTSSGIVTLLEPWFTNRSKSMTKSPKLYISDTGLLCSLLNIHSVEDLLRAPSLGAIWETAVFAELRKEQIRRTGGWEIYFWRDRNKEIDFLVDKGGSFDLYEAKWAEHPGRNSADAFVVFENVVRAKSIRTKSIICRASNPFPIAHDVQAMPLRNLELA